MHLTKIWALFDQAQSLLIPALSVYWQLLTGAIYLLMRSLDKNVTEIVSFSIF